MLRNIVVLEELHQIVRGEAIRSDLQGSIVEIMVRESRKFGFGLICVDQSPDLPNSITGNCQTRVCLGVQSGGDALVMSRMMALSREQSDYLLALPSRTAIVSYPPYPLPFLMAVRQITEDAATEEQIKRSKEALLGDLSWIPANQPKTREQGPKKGETKAGVTLPWEEQDYLIKIARDPFTPATVRDTANGIPLARGHQLRQRLRAKELIEEARLSMGKGGQVLVVAPSVAGWGYLEEIAVPGLTRPQGKGGLAHSYGQHVIYTALRQKHPEGQVAIEDGSHGKAVDLSLRLLEVGSGQTYDTAYELLCKGEAKEIRNIVQDLDAGYDRVVMCCETAEALQSLKEKCERELTKQELERVEFTLLGELYKEIQA